MPLILIHRKSSLVASALALSLLAGCAAPVLIGDKPSATPPQLVPIGAKDAQGKDILTWDRPQAFGKVPPAVQIVGDISCMRASVNLYALGFHPEAADAQGKPLPSGGFFCALKPQGELPDLKAPRLVRADGVLGWDRPAAFGKVPESELGRAKALCSPSGAVPLAYHPGALNESGQPIPGGGFFCVAPAR